MRLTLPNYFSVELDTVNDFEQAQRLIPSQLLLINGLIFMADYDIRPLQLRILKILLAVDKVCKEHGLRYYIMAGTMLGAVRHKGFIPLGTNWILDIGMPRADYDLLMSHSKEWLPSLMRLSAQKMIRIIHYLLPRYKMRIRLLSSVCI